MSYYSTVRAVGASNVNVSVPSSANFDGLTLNFGDPVLLINQTNPVQNGVWIFRGVGTAMLRPSLPDPFASGSSVQSWTLIPIGSGGALFGGQRWAMSTPGFAAATVDTTPLGFTVDSLGPAGGTTLTLANGMNSAVNGQKYGYIEVAAGALTTAFQISGFSDTVNALDRVIFNPTMLPMTLKHEDTVDEPTPANRIHNPAGGDVVCTVARLRYSAALARWLLISFEPAWSPLQMRGTVAWWRSDAVNLDGAGNVQSAIDLTGNGFTLSQAAPTARPAFSPNGGPNGRAFWTGNAETHLDNTVTNLLPSGQDHTVFAAVQPSLPGGSIITLRCSAAISWMGYWTTSGTTYVYSDGQTSTNNATAPTMTTGVPITYTATSRVGSLMALRINGTPMTLTSSGVSTSETGTPGFTLLGRLDTAGFGFSGQFYEMFVLDHAATDAEIAVAEAYLTQQWG
jgi:hypothetical protein